MRYVIDTMKALDWEQVKSIYLEGIATANATFEEDAPLWEQWDVAHLQRPRLVIRDEENILGWAALSRVSSREVYRGVAEVSLYVGEKARGRGIGCSLLKALIEESESEDIWTLQASIFPENQASIKLHLKCEFREVGRREKIGELGGIWRDTVLLERRSKKVGVESEQAIAAQRR